MNAHHPAAPVAAYIARLTARAGGLLIGAPTDVVVTAAPPMAALALTVGFALAELLVVEIRYRADNHSFSFSEFLLVFGLLFFAPVTLLLAQGAGLAAVLVLHRRQPAVRLAFNLAQTAVATLLAVMTVHALAPHATTAASTRTWVATLAALAVSATTGAIAVTLAISLVERRSHLAELPRVAGFSLLGTLSIGSFGLLAVVAAHQDRFTVVLALVPVLVTWVTYRGYVRERTARSGIQFLYDTTSRLQTATALEPGLVQLLTATRDMFRSELAEIAIHRPDAKGWLRIRVDQDGVRPAQEPARAAAPAWIPDGFDGVTVAVRDAEPGARLLLEELDAQSTMVCRLHGEANLGVLLVARRRVGVPRFDRAELGLFSVLAHQVGVALDNGNLERSLAQLTALEEELRFQATHDALTGLANRAKLREHVEAHRDTIGAVLLVDLDDFKTINDSLGHAAGDEVLILVADRLRACVRPDDIVARLGGDEFAIVLGGTTDRATVLEVADRIDATLDAPMRVCGNDVVIRASVGIAFREGGDLTLEDILRHADVAMYRAKRAGKGRWKVFDQGMDLEARQRLDMTTALRAAVTNGELRLRYQPILQLRNGDVAGFEALVRWEHRTLGELLPGQFLPVAEEATLLQPIGRWVLSEACAEARRWNDLLPDRRPLAVHVNLSVVQLVDAEFVAYVAYVLGEHRIDASQLVVEINEDGIARTDLGLADRVRELKTLGVRLAIDDFGTGPSSLARLPDLPVDFLKLDGTFVRALGTSSPRATVTRHLLSLATSLGVDTVAEGIEHPDQLAALRLLDCPLGQGFHLAPVLTAAEAREMLFALAG